MSSVDCVHPNNVMLAGGGAAAQWHLIRSVNPPTHPATMGKPMPRHYVLSDRRMIERVPRPLHLSPPSDCIPAITFSVNGWAGVRVMDIQNKTVTIDAGNDTVLAEYGWRSIVVNLEWPGYECRNFGDPMRSRIDVRPDGMDITRQNLAIEICGLLSSFHKSVSTQRSSIPLERGKWTLTAGPEGIRVQDIVLFSAHYYRKMWVPELYVIE